MRERRRRCPNGAHNFVNVLTKMCGTSLVRRVRSPSVEFGIHLYVTDYQALNSCQNLHPTSLTPASSGVATMITTLFFVTLVVVSLLPLLWCCINIHSFNNKNNNIIVLTKTQQHVFPSKKSTHYFRRR